MTKQLMLSVSALALMAGAANAQNVDATGTTTVKSQVVPAGERMAADHAPLGIRAGSFLVIPKVELTETYNDNIYATDNNEDSDFITSTKAEVAARSNWSRHALNAVAKGEFRRYADKDSEDQDNYQVATDGRVDVMRDTSIGGGLSYAQDHEDRGDPNSIGSSVEPVELHTTVGRIGAYRGLGKANARFDSEVKSLEYDNGQTAGGAIINNGIRDRNEYTQALRLGYKLNDTFEVFGRGAWDNRVYDNKAFNRTNRGQTYTAGTTFDMSGKTKGEVYAGMADRNYSNSGLKDIDAAVWGGKVTWNASDLTSVIASVDRGIEETTIGGSSGFVNTDYRLGVEHALTRDILLKGNVGFANSDYEGNAGTQREDDVYTAGLGADYWFNRCLKAGIGYTYTDRSSNITGGDFSRNTVLVKLTATY